MSYYKVKDKPVLYVDIDSTLITAHSDVPKELRNTGTWIEIGYHLFRRHDAHCNKLKEFAARGHSIVLWSAGGSDWAETVIKALNLDDLVCVIMPKPYWYMDDLEAAEFLAGKRIYIADT